MGISFFSLGLIALLGAVMGSFATVLVHRIPREIPLGLFSHTRSACPSCGKTIPWFRNIPLVTYILQKGRCANCRKKIPIKYFLIELGTLLIFLVTYILFDTQTGLQGFPYWAELSKLLLFSMALVATVFIDLEFRIIPDRFSLGGWALALLASLAWGEPDIVSSLSGGLFGSGLFFLMAWGYEKFKGVEGLGMGDVKMMGWIGSWLGFFCVPFVVMVASISGLIAGLIAMRTSKQGLKTAIPFGPFIAFGAYVGWCLSILGFWS